MSSREIRIAISGLSGCGNTTVSKLVSDELNVKMINYTFHTIADEMQMDFKEFCMMAEKDYSWDEKVDTHQVELARRESCVLGSRLAIWMLEEADLKVFLTASPETRAGRIEKREGGDTQSVIRETDARDARDHARYQEIYRIDNHDYAFADLVINTDRLDQYMVAEIILTAAKNLLKKPD